MQHFTGVFSGLRPRRVAASHRGLVALGGHAWGDSDGGATRKLEPRVAGAVYLFRCWCTVGGDWVL